MQGNPEMLWVDGKLIPTSEVLKERTADSGFVALCAELIKLGARTVKCGQYEATFGPAPKTPPQKTERPDTTDPLDRFPRGGR